MSDSTDFPQQLQQALKHSDNGEPTKAAAIYRDILTRQPNHYEANYSLGMLCHRSDRNDLAIPLIRKSVELRPEIFAGVINLGMMQRDEGLLADSRVNLEQATTMQPDSAIAHVTLALLLMDLGELDAALQEMKVGQRLDPEDPEIHARVAMLHQVRGEDEAAANHYRKVIDRLPNSGTAHRSLAFLQKHTNYNDDISRAEKAFNSPQIPARDRMLLGNALGKVFDDLGHYDKAFAYLHTANKLQRQTHNYSIEQQKPFFERHKKWLNKELPVHCRDYAISDDTAIFVVGMPRSGTSLVEQILASHPLAHGAGEVEYSRLMVDAVQQVTRKPFPVDINRVAPEILQNAGFAYIKKLRSNAGNAKRVIDKLPHNFLRVGLYAAVLPGARIIHCVRHPLDNCMSIYQHLFGPAHAYASDLSDLGQYYRLYRDLMEWWEEILPGHIHQVRYEDLVIDTEKQVRLMLDYCDLPFHEDCLTFHKTRRQVKTPSASQVRQPVYQKSVSRWKNYQEHLGPLFAALDLYPDVT